MVAVNKSEILILGGGIVGRRSKLANGVLIDSDTQHVKRMVNQSDFCFRCDAN